MSLKAYHKANVSYMAVDSYQDSFGVRPIDFEIEEKPPVTMWGLLGSMYRRMKHLVATSSTAGLVIPALFIVSGFLVIYQQFQPVLAQKVKESAGYYDQGTASLVQDSYIANRLQYLSNPGASYFQSLTSAAFSQHILAEDKASGNFHGTFYLTIPSLGFNRLPVAANVDSGDKDVYDGTLSHALAHFKGTSLPFSSVENNIVIYGHSAGGSYNPNPSDVMAAFSFLSNLQLGDDIIINIQGQDYHYRMTRSKIVEPDDTSIITGTPGKKTLTLFTCYPNGNSSQRYVAIATPVV